MSSRNLRRKIIFSNQLRKTLSNLTEQQFLKKHSRCKIFTSIYNIFQIFINCILNRLSHTVLPFPISPQSHTHSYFSFKYLNPQNTIFIELCLHVSPTSSHDLIHNIKIYLKIYLVVNKQKYRKHPRWILESAK